MKNIKKIIIMMLAMLLILVGCGSTTPEEDMEAQTDEVQSEEDDEEEYIYRDVIRDRGIVEGRFALYFISTQTRYYQWTGANSLTGDAMLLIAPDGTTMLVDSSMAISAIDIVRLLQALGIEKLDYFVNTHGHVDHCGGFSTVANYVDIGKVYMPPDMVTYYGKASNVYGRSFMKEVERLEIPFEYLVEGDTLQFGNDVSIEIFNPPVDFDYNAGIDANESSLVMKVTYGESSFLLGADIGYDEAGYGRATEIELAEKHGEKLQADIVKMNHHGQPTSSSDIWRETVKAKVVVAQTDTVRDDVVMMKYMKDGTLTLSNVLDGTVLVYTTGDGTYDIQVEGERYTDYYGSLDTKEGHLRIE